MIRETWRRLEQFIETPRRRLGLVSASSLVGGFSEAATLVIVVGVGLVAAGQRDSIGQLPVIGVEPSVSFAVYLALGLSVANVGVHYLNARLIGRLSTDVLRTSRQAAVAAFLSASWDRQAREREGQLHETVGVLAQQSSQLAVSIAAGLTASLHVASLLLVSMLVDPIATIVVIFAGSAIFAALRPMSSLTRRRSQEFLDANGELLTDLAKVSAMAMEVRTFGVARQEEQRIGNAISEAAGRARATRVAARFGETLYRDLAIVFLVGAVAFIYLIDATEIAALGAVVLLVVRAANSTQGIQGMRQQVSERGPDLLRLVERLESLRGDADISGSVGVEEFKGMELAGVDYAYGTMPALRNVSLRIEPGEAIGIVGPSGGGKSTLVQVVVRLRVPASGNVSFSGVPYQEIGQESWSKLVALVAQEPHLMEGTVADNIRFLRAGISDEDVRRAATSAHILDEIQQLPDGLGTRLGARGIGLSGGQRQRVAIARALAGRPSLLVLDEPTSALDMASEERLRDTLNDLKGSLSILIVTHRPVPLSVCDRVLRVEGGRIGSEHDSSTR